MSIEITVTRPTSGFAMVPNEMLRDPVLSMEARGFLSYLLSFDDGWKHHRAQLAAATGFGDAKFRRISKELRAAGYLDVVPIRGDGGKMLGKEWVLTFDRSVENQRIGDRSVKKPKRGLSTRGSPTRGSQHPLRIPEDKENHKKEEYQVYFDAFWDQYPRKVGKQATEGALKKACKRHGIEVVFSGLQRHRPGLEEKYNAGKTGQQNFCPHPSTWLNQGRYLDPAAESVLSVAEQMQREAEGFLSNGAAQISGAGGLDSERVGRLSPPVSNTATP